MAALIGPVVAAGMLAATLGAAPTPAAAAAPLSCITTPDGGAAACFQPTGDHVYAYDTAADGHRAVAVWHTSDGRSGTCEDTKGYDTVQDCNQDLTEGATIDFRAETRDGTTVLSMSGYARATS